MFTKARIDYKSTKWYQSSVAEPGYCASWSEGRCRFYKGAVNKASNVADYNFFFFSVDFFLQRLSRCAQSVKEG